MFMCTLYVFDSKSEYVRTHQLSTSMSPFGMVVNLPPPSADLLLYTVYQSFPVSAFYTNASGYRLGHFPSIMHSEFGFSVRHSLSTSASGIPKHVTSSTSFEMILFESRLVYALVAALFFAISLGTKSREQTQEHVLTRNHQFI